MKYLVLYLNLSRRVHFNKDNHDIIHIYLYIYIYILSKISYYNRRTPESKNNIKNEKFQTSQLNTFLDLKTSYQFTNH